MIFAAGDFDRGEGRRLKGRCIISMFDVHKRKREIQLRRGVFFLRKLYQPISLCDHMRILILPRYIYDVALPIFAKKINCCPIILG